MAQAKLKISDPNGKVVFDSSRDRVMSFVKAEDVNINLSGKGYAATYRILLPGIKVDNMFVTVEFKSWNAAPSVNSVYGHGGYTGLQVVYADGYADVTFPWMSVYPGQTAVLTYKIKAFRL